MVPIKDIYERKIDFRSVLKSAYRRQNHNYVVVLRDKLLVFFIFKQYFHGMIFQFSLVCARKLGFSSLVFRTRAVVNIWLCNLYFLSCAVYPPIF